MPELKTHLQVYELLEKSNCKKCGMPTCLAFAVAVIKGEKQLWDCPLLDSEAARDVQTAAPEGIDPEQEFEEVMGKLRDEISSIDFAGSAERLKADLHGDKITIKVLGRDFHVNPTGKIESNCHVNAWLSPSILNYIIHCKGMENSGEWVNLESLEGGRDWSNFFRTRCLLPMQKLAAENTEVFLDIMGVFGGKPPERGPDADHLFVLYPMPRVPFLFCYWLPEDGMDAELNILFDKNAAKNIPVGTIYYLCSGMLTMFERIVKTHLSA